MTIRELFRSRWTPIVAGILVGLLASSGLVYAWNRPYNDEPSLYLLGSGKGLSALITVEGIRVLIVSGTDPIGFGNALADARPLTAPRIDILVVTPGSERVVSRAISITNPQTILEIPGAEGVAIQPEAQRITSITSIALGDEITLAIDSGQIVGSAIPGWSITINAGTSTLLLAERQPVRPPSGISLLAVMGSDTPLSSVPAPAPLAISATVAGGYNDSTWPIGLIETGETARIRLEPAAIRLPGSWT